MGTFRQQNRLVAAEAFKKLLKIDTHEKFQNSSCDGLSRTFLREYVLPRALPSHTSYPLSARMKAATRNNMKIIIRQANYAHFPAAGSSARGWQSFRFGSFFTIF